MLISIYPQVEFAVPGGGGVEKGLAVPGQTVTLPVMLSKEFHQFTFVLNGGVEKPLHDPEGQLAGTVGIGFGRALTRKVAAMVEIHAESSFTSSTDRVTFVNVGLLRGIRHVVVFANAGHSLSSSDHLSHTYLGVGMKLLINEQEK